MSDTLRQPGFLGDAFEQYPGWLLFPALTGSFKNFTQQHEFNLVHMLDHATKERQYAASAAICAVLLRTAGPLWDEHLEAQSTPDAGPARADRLDPLAAVLDRVFPQYIQLIKLKGLPHEQVSQHIRTLIGICPGIETRHFMTQELAATLIHQGDLHAAYDVLLAKPRAGVLADPLIEGMGAQLRMSSMALIRHRQWLAAYTDLRNTHYHLTPASSSSQPKAPGSSPTDFGIRSSQAVAGTSKDHPAGNQAFLRQAFRGQASGAAGCHASDDGSSSGRDCADGMVVLSHEPKLWARAQMTRSLMELYRGCEKHCKDALKACASSPLVSFILLHLYMVGGLYREAREVAVQAAAAAPSDADALGLALMVHALTHAQAVHDRLQGRDEMDDALAESERHAATQARMHEASRWRLAALAADATCEAHLAGLASTAKHCSECMLAAVHGCMLTLDICGDAAAPPHEDRAWRMAAEGLSRLACQALLEQPDQATEPAGEASRTAGSDCTAGDASDANEGGGLGLGIGDVDAADAATDMEEADTAGAAADTAAGDGATTLPGPPAGGTAAAVPGSAVREGEAFKLWRYSVAPLLADRTAWWPAVHFHCPPVSVLPLLHEAIEAVQMAGLLEVEEDERAEPGEAGGSDAPEGDGPLDHGAAEEQYGADASPVCKDEDEEMEDLIRRMEAGESGDEGSPPGSMHMSEKEGTPGASRRGQLSAQRTLPRTAAAVQLQEAVLQQLTAHAEVAAFMFGPYNHYSRAALHALSYAAIAADIPSSNEDAPGEENAPPARAAADAAGPAAAVEEERLQLQHLADSVRLAAAEGADRVQAALGASLLLTKRLLGSTN